MDRHSGLRGLGAWALALALGASLTMAAGPAADGSKKAGEAGPAKLVKYEIRYYVIHSDLDIDTVREAAARMNGMAEEYHRRTKGFAGKIRKKLAFYLFRTPAAYLALGGPEGSAGVFIDHSRRRRPGRRAERAHCHRAGSAARHCRRAGTGWPAGQNLADSKERLVHRERAQSLTQRFFRALDGHV